MPNNTSDNMRDFAEGRSNSSITQSKHREPEKSQFLRMIVLEVISDPNYDLTDEKKKARWQGLGVSNMTYADILPRNSIIARKMSSDEPPMFVFPFFASHLSLPCKPGECLWVMIENPAGHSDAAFWMTRIIEPHLSDDVNHSHPGRSFEVTMNPDTVKIAENEKSGKAESGEDVWHELRNGPVVNVNDDRTTAYEGSLLRGEPEDIFERLITESDASKLMSFEPVARFRKRPGDIAFEGSNNSLIVLGTDRESSIAAYNDPVTELEKSLWTKTTSYPESDFLNDAGTIDIVVGRGQTEATFGKSASTTSIRDAKGKTKGTSIKKELNKSPAIISASEGDPDYVNDRSRILVSQRTRVDRNFDLTSYNTTIDEKMSDSITGDAAIVIKTDKVRLIARNDVQFLVTNFTAGKTPDGAPIAIDESDASKWASITIMNGDIIFKPSQEGYIKLGSENADKALLCTDKPAKPVLGTVHASPITDTSVGFIGTSAPGQGTWAKKILVD
jgi:hypothetical protein